MRFAPSTIGSSADGPPPPCTHGGGREVSRVSGIQPQDPAPDCRITAFWGGTASLPSTKTTQDRRSGRPRLSPSTAAGDAPARWDVAYEWKAVALLALAFGTVGL